ncbi:MAG: ATP-binding protein [Candidatus Woesearchaeota archaeon]
MGLGNLFLRARPLVGKEKKLVNQIEEMLPYKDSKEVSKYKKQFKIDFTVTKLGTTITMNPEIPQIIAKDPLLKDFEEETNKKIKQAVMQRLFQDFAKEAYEMLPTIIAPNIMGMDDIKRAAALQLFATEPVHILLIGDPGTGKTDILRSASQLAPISAFGLGSGTSGVGLVATVKGKEILKGLLPMADGGLCAIDELNLMKDENRAGLYNAMEKGFVTYSKGGTHARFDARINVIATANPRGDKFIGDDIKGFKKQLPFDSALLTRFHLMFIIRKPDIRQFSEISRKIVRGEKKSVAQADIDFVKAYVKHASKIKVNFDKALEDEVVAFAEKLKANEKRYVSEISPRIVVGLMNLAKASARMELRDKVTQADLQRVEKLVENSLSA